MCNTDTSFIIQLSFHIAILTRHNRNVTYFRDAVLHRISISTNKYQFVYSLLQLNIWVEYNSVTST